MCLFPWNLGIKYLNLCQGSIQRNRWSHLLGMWSFITTPVSTNRAENKITSTARVSKSRPFEFKQSSRHGSSTYLYGTFIGTIVLVLHFLIAHLRQLCSHKAQMGLEMYETTTRWSVEEVHLPRLFSLLLEGQWSCHCSTLPSYTDLFVTWTATCSKKKASMLTSQWKRSANLGGLPNTLHEQCLT